MGSKGEEATPFEEALAKTGNGRYNILLLVTCSAIVLAISIDLFGYTIVVNVACDLGLTVSQKGILFSVPFASIILASYPWGYISDTKGRRRTLIVSLPTAFVLSSLCSLSPNWIVLAVLKFASVCFACAANSVTYTLIGESCIQRVRSRYMLLMTCLMILGPAIGAVSSYFALRHLHFELPMPGLGINFTPWRFLMIIMSIPLAIGAVSIYFFYESPKFLSNWEKNDEALDILKSIYAINHKSSKEEFGIKSIRLEDSAVKKKTSLLKGIYEQSAPLFRRPLVGRTLLLYYIVGVAYITNNSCLVWLPHLLDEVTLALKDNASGGICTMLSRQPDDQMLNNTNITTYVEPPVCVRHVDEKTVMALVASQITFASLNFLLAYLPNYRKTLLMLVLTVSAFSGSCLNWTPEPISSVILFMLLSGTCLTMGILASYFVDLFPTSYRGMVSCLSIMVGRGSAFIGINVVANLLFNYCTITFYLWSLLVFSSVIAAWFLPPDKTKIPSVV